MEPAEKKLSFGGQVASLPSNFWFACIIEMFERLSFFGVRAIVALYLVASPGQNGMDLDYAEKGLILGIWAWLQCIIPMVSGGYTDRYGYRKSLAVAFVINIIGYLCMAQSKPIADHFIQQGWEGAGFWVFLFAACMIGTGTAIFKPPIAATVVRSTTEQTSSMGWGIFYWVVNVGGFLAPFGAAMLRGQIDWQLVFYAAAGVTAFNFLPAFLLYKEPDRADVDNSKGPFEVFSASILTLFKDVRLMVFLGIFSCFWLMFMQLWDLLPNFIDEWVDSSDVAGTFGWISSRLVLETGQVKPEMIINIDSAVIIALVIPISWFIHRVNKLAAMIVGMTIAGVGFVGTGATSLGWLCCLMVFVFAIGEIVCSPTFNAYVGLIAPKDKKALYMGYLNIPTAIGWGVGNFLAGYLYKHLGSKFRLAREYLIDNLGMTREFVENKANLPKDRVMETLARALESGDGASLQRGMQDVLAQVDWKAVPAEELSKKLVSTLDQVLAVGDPASVQQATQLLWDLHHPYQVWIYLGAIGLLGTIGMIYFYRATKTTQRTDDGSSEAAQASQA